MIAYVLVKVEPGKESGVAQEIVRVKAVKEAAWTYGFCDILLKAEVESMPDLDKIVFNKLRRTPGVISTETIIVSPIPIYAPRPPSKTRAVRTRVKRRRN
jgi:DNA-binding Lrp family transcriptional regulator